ncbi:MAG: hypothetical protein AAF608_15540, partial [Pseudomonadota bacterium]
MVAIPSSEAAKRPKVKVDLKKAAFQAVLLAAVVLIVVSAVRSAQVNLAALGITSGFRFLERSTGWDYSFSLIERSINDSYLKTLWIGLMNT